MNSISLSLQTINAQLYPDESIIIAQEGVGLYDGYAASDLNLNLPDLITHSLSSERIKTSTTTTAVYTSPLIASCTSTRTDLSNPPSPSTSLSSAKPNTGPASSRRVPKSPSSSATPGRPFFPSHPSSSSNRQRSSTSRPRLHRRERGSVASAACRTSAGRNAPYAVYLETPLARLPLVPRGPLRRLSASAPPPPPREPLPHPSHRHPQCPLTTRTSASPVRPARSSTTPPCRRAKSATQPSPSPSAPPRRHLRERPHPRRLRVLRMQPRSCDCRSGREGRRRFMRR